jgi:hypothetical protein
MLPLAVKSNIKWITETAEIPVLGSIFLFLLMFVPAVVLSFLAQAVIPTLGDEAGFTKAMFALLPGWNLLLWLYRIRLYCFFLPTFIFFGAIALVKALLMVAGIDDGQ